ncbi:hypothetical protein [Oricola thermophila]|uniref:Uncharacterized protein n=1 Tax=Oricola thermophila TaxID=2742145 RepID=A0A6N1V9U0_9HYPH|nr:hypothetical protein [Oricola thermophila]QKV17771.1 hypothetical protein HTY61_04485 [Oricola thermophila]
MFDYEHSLPIRQLIDKGHVTDEDVLNLRREVYRNGVVNREEASGLFAFDQHATKKPDSWREFFVEAIADYIVVQEAPRGYISEANAEWLIENISKDGVVDHRTELELLIKSMELANSVPPKLAAFALQQVANAVLEGKGVIARDRELKPGVIGETEVELLRRILYASGSDGSVAVTRNEAEVLFDLNDRTSEAENHPSWSELFIKAIACSVMAASGYEVPDREEALRREEWLNDTSVNLGGFFSRMFSGSLSAHMDAVRAETGSEAYYARRNAQMAGNIRSAEKVDKSEAAWLAERIGRDGKLHENEKELLAFLKKESPEIHPILQPLLDKVA